MGVEGPGASNSLRSGKWKEIMHFDWNQFNILCFVPIFDRCDQQKAIKVKLPTTNYLKVSIILM